MLTVNRAKQETHRGDATESMRFVKTRRIYCPAIVAGQRIRNKVTQNRKDERSKNTGGSIRTMSLICEKQNIKSA
jgi:hypothetical protein